MSTVFESTDTITSWDNDYYHPIAERYYDEAIPSMLKLMGAKPGDTVLDAGCGPGVHSIRAVKYGCKVTAIDISRAMLSEATARVNAAGAMPSVEFEQQDLTKLTYPDASFRFVFSWGVIIHIREVEKALSELSRIVAPGGSLALYVTNDDSWDKKIEDFSRLVLRKPLDREALPLGSGVWYEMHGEKIWVWQFAADALAKEMAGYGLNLRHHVVGEYTEIQRRLSGPVRHALLRLNNNLYRRRVSPSHAAANLFVFSKPAAR